MDWLVEELKEFYQIHSRNPHWKAKLPLPATLQELEEAEERLGFPFPSLLREVYLEVANGGFGPGLKGVDPEGWQGMGYSLSEAVDLYLSEKEFYSKHNAVKGWEEKLKNLLPICEGGCSYIFMLDCRLTDGPVVQYDSSGFLSEEAFQSQSPSLREWLADWLKEVDAPGSNYPPFSDYGR